MRKEYFVEVRKFDVNPGQELNELIRKINAEVRKQLGGNEQNWDFYTEAIYPDFVIIRDCKAVKLYKAALTLDKDGTVSLGSKQEVVQAYIPALPLSKLEKGDSKLDSIVINDFQMILEGGEITDESIAMLKEHVAEIHKAKWTAAAINDLPDSSFLYVEDGGEKDDGGKTKPRSLRHFPVKDAQGNIDLPHLRNALARIPQSDLPKAVKDKAISQAEKWLEEANKKKTEKSDKTTYVKYSPESLWRGIL